MYDKRKANSDKTRRGEVGFVAEGGPCTGERLALSATANVVEGGWVDLAGPLTVRAGEAFVAVPELPPR